jgi:hypothetical protein
VARLDIDHFVLDALANDMEAIEDILRMLNSDTELGWRDKHPAPFTREEVLPVLARLIGEDLVEACVPDGTEPGLRDAGPRVLPDGSWDEVWFRMTPRGRIVHSTWDPVLPDSDSNTDPR